MQQDIDGLLRWLEMGQMPFNIHKCKCLHMSGSNPNHVYRMGGCDIEQTAEKRDLAGLAESVRQTRQLLDQIFKTTTHVIDDVRMVLAL